MSVVDVAAAILIRPDGKFLLAQRPPGKVYAGYWEFPGGKVEPGEPIHVALARELDEELGVRLVTAYPWMMRTFAYPHATVRLHFFRVTAWDGEPHGRESQAFTWTGDGTPDPEPMLPANTPILAALKLPPEYAISNAADVGVNVFLDALEERVRGGLRLVQIRDHRLSAAERRELAAAAVEIARPFGARVLVNGDEALARAVGADGLHIRADQLVRLDARPDFPLCAASCHNRGELERAEALGLDFVVLGPVQATPTHPGVTTLGWARFREVAHDAAIPVYALGGMRRGDIETAWAHGAHGVAMIRGAW